MLVDDHLFCLLTYVCQAAYPHLIRAGSVIFLVGVGSLVCWKLWEHWRAGGGCAPALLPPPPSPPDSATSARQPRPTRGILASLLEEDLVENPDDFEDEDPAFIHLVLDLTRDYIAKVVLGKYFGPSSPCDDTSLISDVSEPGSEVQAKHYLADASASYAHGDEGVVSSSEASLPTDEDSDDELCDGNSGSGGSRRVVRRRHRASRLHRRTPATASATQTQAGGKRLKENGLVPACHPVSNSATCHPMQDNWPSSESSPDSHPATRHRATRHHPPQPLSPDTEDMVDRRQRLLNMPQNRYDGSTLGADNRNEEEEEVRGMAQSVSSASLADLMEKLRQRAQRPSSLSRDNSVASSLSELLTSPLGSRCFPLKREDSVCSNMSGVSDITASECSEASLEVSMREDLAASTLTCLDDIEHELHDLKSSMLEMNQEVTKFTSRPDPYTFKTTYSDYSMGSGESRPPSALEVPFSPRSRLGAKVLPPTRANVSSDVENPDSDPYQQASEASGSMEWDSPQHGWSSSRPRPVSLPPTLPSHTTLCSAPQDDTMPSLEWDNGCLNQYSEENSATRHNTLDDVFHASTQERYQLLPDHSSLELDLEEELQSPQGTMAEWDLPPPAPMTTSVDSAIHSGTGSRSTSSSPIPPGMNRSLLSDDQ